LLQVAVRTGWAIVAENRGGAICVISARKAARTKPGGYTLLISHDAPHGINPGDFLSRREPRDSTPSRS
jgi:hypothetical protein